MSVLNKIVNYIKIFFNKDKFKNEISIDSELEINQTNNLNESIKEQILDNSFVEDDSQDIYNIKIIRCYK